MSTSGRKQLLCQQTQLTGIDFVWVDPADHRRLSVFFVVEPNDLDRPVDITTQEFRPTITGLEDETNVVVDSFSWSPAPHVTGADRLTLSVVVENEGDFQNYRLDLVDVPDDGLDSRLDRFCSGIDFSFKQPCPSPFDCAPSYDCPDPSVGDYPVDYLARDFESLRNALLTFARDKYPDWEAQVTADQGVMIAELLSALGDEFSFLQDQLLREAWLDTQTQRRSFRNQALLVDYRPDPGTGATGYLIARLYEGDERPAGQPVRFVRSPAGVRAWAYQEDQPPIPFEVGHVFEQMIDDPPASPVGEFELHSHWTDLKVYQPDPDDKARCLPIGAREIIVEDNGLLRTPGPVSASLLPSYWVGKRVLIETRPTNPADPVRRAFVQIDEPIEELDDPLTGAGPLMRIHWRADDALPYQLDQAVAFVSANILPIRAGLTYCDQVIVGDTDGPSLAKVPRTVKRGGPYKGATDNRPTIHRHTLSQTVTQGLGWRDAQNESGEVRHEPEALLWQMPAVGTIRDAVWRADYDSLGHKSTDESVTVEPGEWSVVATYRSGTGSVRHFDYASDKGYTIRFGDGEFAALPPDNTLFKIFYRTGPGAASNVPADTINVLQDPALDPSPCLTATWDPEIRSVRNPLPTTNGRDPQSISLGHRIAPAAFKSIVYRAVRNQDYREQAERLDWVQEGGAVTRWTGAWASTFVSADPIGSFSISEGRINELENLIGAVRQVNRLAIVRQPVFLPIDLRIAICVAVGSAFGDVAERVIDALSPSGGKTSFFHPDRFSFGDPLSRPSLEAAIACVDGVSAITEIQYRVRGMTGYSTLDTPEFAVASDRILKVENNPNRPGQGSIRIYDHEIPELAA